MRHWVFLALSKHLKQIVLLQQGVIVSHVFSGDSNGYATNSASFALQILQFCIGVYLKKNKFFF
jgi:hypothetical protein